MKVEHNLCALTEQIPALNKECNFSVQQRGKKMYWGMMLIAAKAITAEGESHSWEEAICS